MSVEGTVPSQWLVDEKVRRQDAEARVSVLEAALREAVTDVVAICHDGFDSSRRAKTRVALGKLDAALAAAGTQQDREGSNNGLDDGHAAPSNIGPDDKPMLVAPPGNPVRCPRCEGVDYPGVMHAHGCSEGEVPAAPIAPPGAAAGTPEPALRVAAEHVGVPVRIDSPFPRVAPVEATPGGDADGTFADGLLMADVEAAVGDLLTDLSNARHADVPDSPGGFCPSCALITGLRNDLARRAAGTPEEPE